MTFWIILILLAALALFLLAPSPRRSRAESWKGTAFAHRGLYGGGIPENTLDAFDRACRMGFGIELDVQLTRDGRAVVFHDADLKRMTGDPRRVDEVDFDELRTLKLDGTGQIPTFREALDCIGGRTPLLVELKDGKTNAELCQKSTDILKNYTGRYIMESFNPLILRWLHRHTPEIIRGQLVGLRSDYITAHMSHFLAAALSTLSLNFLGRPDFVAYNVAGKFCAPGIQRRIFRTPMAAWTVRDPETYERCIERGEMPIFENFIPQK